jgi:hypothetical protein
VVEREEFTAEWLVVFFGRRCADGGNSITTFLE